MFQIILSFIIVLSVSSFSLLQAQVVGRGKEVRLQHILPQQAQFGANISSIFRGNIPADTSANGKVFWFNDQLIKKEGDTFRIVEIPLVDELNSRESPEFLQEAELSDDGRWLILSTISGPITDPELRFEMIFYDVEKEQVIASLDRISSVFNADATVMPLILDRTPSTSGSLIGVIERNGTEFQVINTEQKVPPSSGAFPSFISPSGDRIFLGSSGTRWFVMDRLPSGEWSEPKEIIIRDNDGNPLNFNIFDIAQNGRRFLGDAWLPVEGSDSILFGSIVADDQNGEWIIQQIPQTINISRNPRKDIGLRTISEDGKIAVAFPHKLMFGSFDLHDLIVFMQTPSGEWVRRQVNPPNVGVENAKMTKDGTQLFYMPFPEPVPAAVPNAPVFDN